MSSDGKKDMSQPLAPAYDPKAVEADWYDWWVKQGYFTADPKSEKPPYVIVIPPPNVTGALHIGHALTAAVEDSIIRWRRMNGYNTLWLPGTDHAGIATQVVVEKRLKREQNISRHDLGRERFVEEVWKWKNQYGNRILNQLRRTGCSVDWTREHFTLDDQLSKAVQVSFIQLFNEGLIYRAKRLVNWSCALKSAISDLEVEYITLDKPTRLRVPGHEKTIEFGFLTEFAYKVDGTDEEIVVATTRLETMLGDTAVAVHPDDARYKHLHGKLLVHPFVNRKIPIITDAELVDMSFGTGAVKVTPAHDPNDYQTGLRHKLAEITVFTTDGRINENGGEFQGMMRFDARLAMEKRMEELKILREKKPNPGQRLGQCSRSGDIIEPLLKPQWWMNCKPMAEESIKAARDGRLEILPEIHRDTWFRWLENIRDWCISRQLWWGHRIPAYYVVFAGEPEIIPDEEDISRWVTGGSLDFVTALAKAKFPDREFKLLQDEDVLDTWYSSGLFPFSTMGWPDLEHPDFKAFFPTALLETGHDILFFWVARMVMMSIKLTGQIPFKQVYLHAMVRDAHGRKMSKALGNVIDPLDVIEGISLENLHTKLKDGNLDPREVEKAIAGQKKDYPEGIPECGTDALRFALCAYTFQGRDINLDVNRVVGYRQFCNKIWNATKFLMLYVGTNFTPLPIEKVATLDLTSGDKWILSRLNACAATCQSSMEKFEFADVTQSAYSFWLYEFCDVYVELSKPTLQADETPDNADRKRTVKNVLYTCLETGLRILAPFMPFVTEELWQRLPRRPDYSVPSICIAAYPTPIVGWSDSDVEERMKLVLAAVSTARSMRVAYGLHPAARPTFYISSKSQSTLQAYQVQADDVKTLAQAGTVEVLPQGADVPSGCGIRPINDQADLSLVLKGVVDFDNEIKSLNKKKAALEKAMEQLQKKMEIPGYEQKVPENIREQNSAKLQSQKSEMDTIIKAIENFTMLRDS